MPDKNINIDTDVILRYLEKTASPEEIRQLREWIALSEENANYFQEIRNIWEVTTPAVDPEKIDTGKEQNPYNATGSGEENTTDHLLPENRRHSPAAGNHCRSGIVDEKRLSGSPYRLQRSDGSIRNGIHADTAGQLEGLAERRKYAEISDRFHQQHPGSGNVRRSLL